MESEDEIDIESEFISQSLSGDILGDLNEPPSQLALLHPDVNQHPWALEQNWYLENGGVDEKSRSLIEKMMLEEQYYVNGGQGQSKQFSPEKPPPPLQLTHEEPKPTSSRRQWTDEEKDTFYKGLEIFGRKWSKIAELLPQRTVLQVKHFGYSHLRKSEKSGESSTKRKPSYDASDQMDVADSLNAMISSVTTAQPTVSVSNLKTVKKSKAKTCTQASKVNSVGALTSETSGVELQPSGENVLHTDKLEKFPDSEVIRLNKDHTSDSEEIDVDIEDDDEDIKANIRKQFTDTKPEQTEKSLCFTSYQTVGDADTHESVSIQRTANANIPIESDEHSSASLQTSNIKLVERQIIFSSSADDISESEVLSTEECSKTFEELSKESTDTFKNQDMVYNEVATADLYVGSENLNKEKHQMESVAEDTDVKDDIGEDQKESPSNYSIQGSDGKRFTLPNPTEDVLVDHDIISDQETEIFCEFFDGRPGIKTAERYLKIRNHIINTWKASKPKYLYKTQIRSGLKKCGDVNIIGRIHSYLEQIGAINFGCEECQYNRTRPNKRVVHKRSHDDLQAMAVLAKKETLNQRKRRVRDFFGVWIDEKDMEGRTIDHEKEEENVVMKEPPKIKRRKPAAGYDPFKLVTCKDFTSAVPAPFEVEVDLSVMVLMDVHSHLCKTEVIGLLGGHYDVRRGLLVIGRAEPCESLSTGMQCEMDPVSQTVASEEIRKHGMKVVGWYHSHPSFPPNPSVRDIETQQTFQEWFSVGKMPFVGFIVNPYNPNTSTVASDIRCLCISKPKTSDTAEMGAPYQFKFKRTTKFCNINDLLGKLASMVETYSRDKNRVEILQNMSASSSLKCLDKILKATEVHLKDLKEDREKFLHNLKNVLETGIKQKTFEVIT